MKKVVLLLVILSFAFTSCKKEPGSLSGNVYWKYNDYVGNKPDAGSEVFLYDTTFTTELRKVTTDVQGNWKLENIPVGEYYLLIRSNNTTNSPDINFRELIHGLRRVNFHFSDVIKNKVKKIEKVGLLSDSLQGLVRQLLHSDECVTNLELTLNKIDKINLIRDKQVNLQRDLIKQLFDSIPSSYLIKLHLSGSVSNKIDTRFVEVKEKQNEVIITDFGITYY